MGWAGGGACLESCLPDQQAAAQRKLSGFFVRIPSGTSSSEGGAQKNQAAQSAAAALLRPPTPRISERMRANPVDHMQLE